jgi:septum site-determining protein MinC
VKDGKLLKKAALEIKGSSLRVLVLQVIDPDRDALYSQLADKIARGGAFFNRSPLLIDISRVDEAKQCNFDLIGLINCLRNLDIVPVAIRGAAACLDSQVVQAGIGLLPVINPTRQKEPADGDKNRGKEQKTVAAVDATSSADTRSDLKYRTKIITQPVRSGQQIFAHGDLVVLSSVNAGAEVLAKGNIHIYGALRGRALAGTDGDESARIFSTQCNPELVSIAGDYMVNESLDPRIVNQGIMISRNIDGLIFTPMHPGQVQT